MKIAYLGQMADISRETSIAKKIRDQCAAWRSAGQDVRYFALAPTTSVWKELTATVPATIIPRGNAWQRAGRSHSLCRAIADWAPDIVYLRYAHFAAGLPALFRCVPAVFEINSDDSVEYALTLGRAKALYHRLTRKRMLRSSAGFVPVTNELARLVDSLGRPLKVVANSIDLSASPSLNPISTNAPTRLVFIGSPRTPWHGLDRIAELARLFPDWGVDIIGDDLESWRYTVSSAPPPNIRLHGHLDRDRYLPLLSAAMVALGTFGLYQKNMHEACPLKVREYLALGLPVIGACADTDIPPDADYYLKLPNNTTPLDSHRGAIMDFVQRWRGRRVSRASVMHLDTSVKESQRLAFMREVLASRASVRI